MARSKNDIKAEITTNFMGNANIAAAYGFNIGDSFVNTFSLVSLENFLFEILAYAIYVHELLFDTHKTEIDQALLNQKSGRLSWYRTMALAFQYGFDLIEDTDVFDNSTATQDQIDASKIIKYAAVNESVTESRVIIKIAGEENDVLAPLQPSELASFEAYLQEIRYAGVQITVVNYLPDLLFLTLQIQRDPLVLDANGMSIKNGNFPVIDAIEAYMKLLPFDGEFVIFDFLKYIEANAEGVVTPTALNVESSFIDPLTDAYGSPVSIPIKTIPFSGYFKVDNYNSISYVV
ncbi:nucleotidyltransferase [Pseudotamlana carrageenivorans]|uniref:Nucleotidyltransferase n=1 Tax=Pseudotamlana carrageenivorans TaxID=2069432 RepID=A0A2I7SF05_9FLAO|nr:nucleotidyltransferase [Tamlana carrageenivorans]AUS04477.1 nucleotidyltransferase [Tamlana carrageenivorans]